MGFGFGQDENGKPTRWGFESVADWLDSVILSFPAPWTVADLYGKYYGTEIRDARGISFLSFWNSIGEPSKRQKGEMTDEQWADYCCDSHWESAFTLHLCETVVRCRNIIAEAPYRHEELMAMLRDLVLKHGRWEETVDDEIKCGGPERRETSMEHDTREGRGFSLNYRQRLEERNKRACKTCGEIRKATADFI